ncbi:hypothetical protein FGO68_gene5202 [Halteria grandinella]|uniref:HIT domain-containing protein n=1 Tax=Halteria grandinella TaxID=5974 RepID=A0A8J8NJ04_HALGN|nr:hypothetical protein FGO68_gene5202 [Halteria grandinella]
MERNSGHPFQSTKGPDRNLKDEGGYSLQRGCLFCSFLEAKENMIFETDRVYVFRDISPKASLGHFLMIPKWHIRSYRELIQVEYKSQVPRSMIAEVDSSASPLNQIAENIALLEHMQVEALNFLDKEFNEEYRSNDFYLGFHIPQIVMMPHLHMHILIGKLNFRGNIEFSRLIFSSIEWVMGRLEAEQKRLQKEYGGKY